LRFLSLRFATGIDMSIEHAQRRCAWADGDPLICAYHDQEWGVPQHDPRMLWEMLMLEGFQAGLAWITVLRKREAFRKAFAGFDPAKVARFKEKDILRLLQDEGIIRSRAKIEAASVNLVVASVMQPAAVYRWTVGALSRPSRARG